MPPIRPELLDDLLKTVRSWTICSVKMACSSNSLKLWLSVRSMVN